MNKEEDWECHQTAALDRENSHVIDCDKTTMFVDSVQPPADEMQDEHERWEGLGRDQDRREALPSDIVLQALPSQFLQDQVEKKRDRATQVYSYILLYVFVAGLLFLNKQTTAYYPAGSGTHPHIALQVQQENMDSFWRIPHQASTRSSRVELFYPPLLQAEHHLQGRTPRT